MSDFYRKGRSFFGMKSFQILQRVKGYLSWLFLISQDGRAAFFQPRVTSKLLRRYIRLSQEGLGNGSHLMKSHPCSLRIAKAKKISMLHEEVLALLHFFVISSRGRVLEIGSYIGGSTVMMASAAKQFKKYPIIAIEPGGQNTNHPDIPSENIFADLKANIECFNVSDYVYLINSYSSQAEVYQTVRGIVGSEEIDLLFIDADGQVGRDIEKYSSLLRDKAVLVLDDYSSGLAPDKAVLVRQWVDTAVSEGRVISLGVWGWGTWIGLYVKHPS